MVIGYRAELPDDEVKASFSDDHLLELTPDLVGATVTNNHGIIGEGVNLTVDRTGDFCRSTVILHLAKHLVYTKYRDADGLPKTHLILQLKKVVRSCWINAWFARAAPTMACCCSAKWPTWPVSACSAPSR